MRTSPARRALLALAALAAAALLGACADAPEADAPAGADETGGVRFVDVAAGAGIDLLAACGNIDKKHLIESTGSGAAVADYDNDGDEDIYLGTAQTTDEWLAGERPRANALYRNDGGGRFTEVAAEAGVDLRAWTAGTYFVDYDDDGDRDLFVTTWGPNVLYRNEGDGTFTDVTAEAGVAGAPDAWSASAAFGDLDGDGDLDLYVTNYCEYDLADPPFGAEPGIWKGIESFRGPMGFIGQEDALYRNDGDGRFTEVTREAGLDDHRKPLYGLGVVMADLDDDTDLDIYVANDSGANYLWRNDGGFRFTEIATGAGVAMNEAGKAQAGMGVDAADYNGDGIMDLFVTNFSHDWNTLHPGRGDLIFNDDTFAAGLQDMFLPLAWGTKFFDYDNDGWLDVFVANGHIYPEVDGKDHLGGYKSANSLSRNQGDGTFANEAERLGPGLAIIESTRGVAVSDLDRDGDLDLVLTNIDSTPNVLINEGGNEAAWITVVLVGTSANRDGVGARLVLEAGGRTQVREVNPFGSYLSQGDYAVHFGLGDAEVVDSLRVRWPGGGEATWTDLPVRRRVVLTEGEAEPVVEEPRDGWPS